MKIKGMDKVNVFNPNNYKKSLNLTNSKKTIKELFEDNTNYVYVDGVQYKFTLIVDTDLMQVDIFCSTFNEMAKQILIDYFTNRKVNFKSVSYKDNLKNGIDFLYPCNFLCAYYEYEKGYSLFK